MRVDQMADCLTLGPARRRRRMHRRLRELDRLDSLERHRGLGRGSDKLRRLIVAVTTAGVTAAAAATVLDRDLATALSPLTGAPHRTAPRPPQPSSTGGSVRFVAHQIGRPDVPVAYDPCLPVQVYVNDDIAPFGTGALVKEAVDTVSQATGLQMVMAGSTHRLPATGAHVVDGEPTTRTQNVLVAWTTDEQVPQLTGNVAGLGGSSLILDQATMLRHYTSGRVSLDTSDLTRMLHAPKGRALVRAVIMHELGHVVGLAHVHDPRELMNEDNEGLTSFGPGDLRGLSMLGSGHCSN